MTEEIKNRILSYIGDISGLLEQYTEQTMEILNTNIDETLEDITARRGETVARVGEKIADIDAVCENCTPQERQQVNRIITSGHIPLGSSKEIKEIHRAALKMRSVYLAIGDKEKQAILRVDARVKELRGELENVSADRKKLNGYSANVRIDSSNSKGSSFDSSL